MKKKEMGGAEELRIERSAQDEAKWAMTDRPTDRLLGGGGGDQWTAPTPAGDVR